MQSLTPWLTDTCEGWVCMLLASGCQWEVLSVWGRLPHRLIPCPRAWGKLPLPEISHCSSLFDCKRCLSPPAAFLRVCHTATIDAEQIWETHSTSRDKGGGKDAIIWEYKVDMIIYLWSSWMGYVVNCWKSVEETGKKNPHHMLFWISCDCAGYQYNKWVWMHSVAVILSEKTQETRVLYFFSGDMFSLVIQVLTTLSRSKQRQQKALFSPEECIFKRGKITRTTASACTLSPLIVHGLQNKNRGVCNPCECIYCISQLKS